MKRLALIVLALGINTLFLPFTGCGKPPKMFDVRGKVTVGGKPLQAGDVICHAEGSKTAGGAPTGPVSSGSYSLMAPLGQYKVTVTHPPVEGKVRFFNAKFENVDTTTLSIEVVESPAAKAYDLELKK